MLYPQINSYRRVIDLSGIWEFRPDPQDVGVAEKWHNGFTPTQEIAVPGSWNEQLEESGLLHYIGAAWFQTRVLIQEEYAGKVLLLRIGSADYAADVWVDGIAVGSHVGGFLPFECDISRCAPPGKEVRIVIRVDNRLTNETIPQGVCADDFLRENRLREETFPATRFDFFPFGGLNRPVKLCVLPASSLRTLSADMSFPASDSVLLDVHARVDRGKGCSVRWTLGGNGQETMVEAAVLHGEASAQLEAASCRRWSPADPYLYTLTAVLLRDGKEIDRYDLSIGLREIRVSGGRLLLNGAPVYLQGFGKHEDFAVSGKALQLSVAVKDFELMKWIHANSFRTSHYPYAEEIMAMADRKGILVIDEVPAVSLDMRHVNEQTMVNHKSAIRELIERDAHHPSVVMWALGNEPNLVGEESYGNGTGKKYWEEIFQYTRTLDDSRPLTVPNCTRAGMDDPVFLFSDVVTINRYYGWYEFPGRLDHAMKVLSAELDTLFQQHGKPVMMTEFGVDTLPGMHSTSEQMFTEEYQSLFLERYITLLRSKAFVVGEHVWNFADFRTPQHFRRVVMNLKGVFTRAREPKSAAFRLREIWGRASAQERA